MVQPGSNSGNTRDAKITVNGYLVNQTEYDRILRHFTTRSNMHHGSHLSVRFSLRIAFVLATGAQVLIAGQSSKSAVQSKTPLQVVIEENVQVKMRDGV